MEDREELVEYLIYGLLIMALLVGGIPLFAFIYVLAAIYLCYNSISSKGSFIGKLFRCFIYILILSFQLTFNALLTFNEDIFFLLPMGRRLIATVLIFLPFIIDKHLYSKKVWYHCNHCEIEEGEVKTKKDAS